MNRLYFYIYNPPNLSRTQIILLFLSTLFLQIGFSQQNCPRLLNGLSILDNPPGCLLCDGQYSGSTRGFLKDTFQYTIFCGTQENSQWISVQADVFGQIVLTIQITECENEKGIEATLFDQNLNFIACQSQEERVELNQLNLVPGEIYWLMIDGKFGDVCDFIIHQNQLSTTTLISSNKGRKIVCSGAEVCFNLLTPGIFPSKYTWEISAGVKILSGGSLADSFICVRFDSLGKQVIGVFPGEECSDMNGRVAQLEVKDEPVFLRKKSFSKCLPDLPFESLGFQIDSFGLTRFVFPTADGCDSVYEFRVERKHFEETKTKKVCEGDTVFVDGIPITLPGAYDFFYEFGTQQNQCDSTYKLQLFHIDTSTQKLTCFPDTFIKRMAIKWETNPDVPWYLLSINETMVNISGRRRTYLYEPRPGDSIINISLEPLTHRCTHRISKTSCVIQWPVKEPPPIDTTKTKSFFRIFPNPSHYNFHVESSEAIDLIEVFDFSGKEVLKTLSTDVDMHYQPAGVYFFRIKMKDEIFIEKVVKI